MVDVRWCGFGLHRREEAILGLHFEEDELNQNIKCGIYGIKEGGMVTKRRHVKQLKKKVGGYQEKSMSVHEKEIIKNCFAQLPIDGCSKTKHSRKFKCAS